MVKLGFRVLERKTTDLKYPFSSHYIKGAYYPHDITVVVNRDHLAEVMFIRFLCCKVIFSFPLFVLF